MIDNFQAFSKVTAATFQEILGYGKDAVFVVDVEGDALYEKYLAAFPEGTNPVFQKRTEHDCGCCRQFIRRVGNVVAVDKSGNVHTVWDDAAKKAKLEPYTVVATALRDVVRNAKITDIFRVGKNETTFGNAVTRSMIGERAKEWHHFYTGVIAKEWCSATPDADRGVARTTVQVFERGLSELSIEAIDTVLSLIEGNNLYRGEEHKASVVQFRKAKLAYSEKAGRDREVFTWTNAHGPASRFRNTVIGTLVTDISNGEDLEKAVKMFESKVAPQNYKRTSAVITPMMIKKAMEVIDNLGLQQALERRFARIDDVSVNDVLWVDSTVKSAMKGGLGDMLLQHAAKSQVVTVDEDKAESISMEDFMQKILPKVSTMEVLFKNSHQGNLVSLTAPVHAEPKQLFKWNNDFAWSYHGNIADSDLRKAVQARGGRVDGVFRFSHSWNYDRRNASLMDLHVFMPGSTIGRELRQVNDHYGNGQRVGWNARKHLSSGGVQDVDYVEAAPVGYVPVENITFPELNRMPQGDYICKIHNWNLRPPTEGGFRAEIEFGGQVYAYEHLKPLGQKEWVTVATVTLKNGAFTIQHHLPCGSLTQEKWGMNTEQYVKVNAVTLSPNYWGENHVGNRHYIFLLEGAKNDEPTRGIYNEFLHSRLEEHRKVFEIIGDKTKCQPTEGQLSGLGFSSTKKDNVIIKVMTGKRQQLFNVHTGA